MSAKETLGFAFSDKLKVSKNLCRQILMTEMNWRRQRKTQSSKSYIKLYYHPKALGLQTLEIRFSRIVRFLCICCSTQKIFWPGDPYCGQLASLVTTVQPLYHIIKLFACWLWFPILSWRWRCQVFHVSGLREKALLVRPSGVEPDWSHG